MQSSRQEISSRRREQKFSIN